MLSLFLVLVVRVIDCELNRIILVDNLAFIFLITTSHQDRLVKVLHLHGPRQYLDWKVNRVTLTPLIPSIMLHEHFQDVPDLNYLSEET